MGQGRMSRARTIEGVGGAIMTRFALLSSYAMQLRHETGAEPLPRYLK
jgi:hypothetical protein